MVGILCRANCPVLSHGKALKEIKDGSAGALLHLAACLTACLISAPLKLLRLVCVQLG